MKAGPTGAGPTGAVLTGAVLTGAVLTGAVLTGAVLTGTGPASGTITNRRANQRASTSETVPNHQVVGCAQLMR
ncbi:pentapeptide repeat-containing protein [Cryobacterium sp. TMT1-3]|uniref:pentapeptide repeat-containing protein n=1 Tax=Cryobacterium sp. TMT1-3 TaxID=1259237 RepID=UPI001F540F49